MVGYIPLHQDNVLPKSLLDLKNNQLGNEQHQLDPALF
jgi:hypothetical protein